MAPEPLFDPDALRDARLRAGLTQSQLARLIGSAGGERVSKWELGVQSPRPEAIRKLAQVLNVDPSQLLQPGRSDLRRLRVSRGLAAKDLAAKAHLALPTLMRWEEEGLQRMPNPKTIAALAAALHVSPAEVQEAVIESRRQQPPDG